MIPLLLHLYPGYKLADLWNLNLTELSLLVSGIDTILRFHGMLSPFVDKKKAKDLKLPPLVDFYYGEDVIPAEELRAIRKELLEERTKGKKGS